MTLTKEQAEFLYRILDQVSVSGEENKAIIVEIMRVLREMLANTDSKPNSKGAN